MKTSKYFSFALAAMALASCSNDDAPGMENGGVQGALLESITVQFVESPRTYATEQAGVETENNIYHALIFAKEASPEHANAIEGDWSVKEVGSLTNTVPIAKGSLTEPKTMDNMATFKGVTQGSKVYVIVNDPKLTVEAAGADLAYKGAESEAKIMAYTAKLEKSYLNSLVLKEGEKPTKQFVMSGMATISSTPVASGEVLKVPVALNREMAKVNFAGSVTTDETKAAFGKVEIKSTEEVATWGDADGLIIVRIPRKVSFFAAQENAWYYPLVGDATTMDWGMKDGKEWTAFDGHKYKLFGDATDAAAGEAFNDAPYNVTPTAAEYRYTWKIGGGFANYSTETKKISSPTFYVSPNYTSVKDNATLILTQATYTGETTIDPIFTAEMMTELGITKTAGYWDTPANLTTFLTTLKAYNKEDLLTLAAKAKYAAETDATKLIDYKKNQKVFYRASISELGKTVTERNFQYRVNGTITTLGAKSIPDAITTEAVDMIVQVTVNPWSLVVSDQDM